MIPKKATLVELRARRDDALAQTIVGFGSVKTGMQGLDKSIVAFTRERPAAALCAAVATGAATGLFLTGSPVRQLTKATGLVVLGPLVGNLVERLMRLASGEPGVPPAAPKV